MRVWEHEAGWYGGMRQEAMGHETRGYGGMRQEGIGA